MNDKQYFGQLAYNYYKSYANNKAFNGQPLPEWDTVSEETRTKWTHTIGMFQRIDPREFLSSSGRTTRMCVSALREASNNIKVYIVVHDLEFGDLLHSILLNNHENINIVEMYSDLINWSMLTMYLIPHRNFKVYFDHYVLELKYKVLLDELYKF